MKKSRMEMLVMTTSMAAACHPTNRFTTKSQKEMFTAAQITTVLSDVQTGADFPRVAMQLKNLGITHYETSMKDGQSVFYGADRQEVPTGAAYAPIPVMDKVNTRQLESDIRSHQQGKSDYLQISRQCAGNGVAKWAVDLEHMTCSYVDKAGKPVWVEQIPVNGYGQMVFTVEQIKTAHSKVKSGADFPAYIRDLRKLGITYYETFVADGHTDYYGAGDYKTTAPAGYGPVVIAEKADERQFKADLAAHQQGRTGYPAFCHDAAKSGIERWVVRIEEMTCTYFDKQGNKVLVEAIAQFD